MTTAADGPRHIGEPGAVLDDETMSRDDKVARLREWRDALRAEARDEDVNLDSGAASRLLDIERALHHLGAGEA